MPYLNIPIQYFDLGILSRDKTNDHVTLDAAQAIKKCKVGIKCATITPDEARVKEFGLKKMWKSPNGTLRNMLNGTVFREPILVEKIPRLVPHWVKPIVIGRHAFADQYNATEVGVAKGDKLFLTVKKADGTVKEEVEVFDYKTSDGVGLAMINTDEVLLSFLPNNTHSQSSCLPIRASNAL